MRRNRRKRSQTTRSLVPRSERGLARSAGTGFLFPKERTTWSCRLHPVTVGAKESFDLSQNAGSQFYGEQVLLLARWKRGRDMTAIVLFTIQLLLMPRLSTLKLDSALARHRKRRTTIRILPALVPVLPGQPAA